MSAVAPRSVVRHGHGNPGPGSRIDRAGLLAHGHRRAAPPSPRATGHRRRGLRSRPPPSAVHRRAPSGAGRRPTRSRPARASRSRRGRPRVPSGRRCTKHRAPRAGGPERSGLTGGAAPRRTIRSRYRGGPSSRRSRRRPRRPGPRPPAARHHVVGFVVAAAGLGLRVGHAPGRTRRSVEPTLARSAPETDHKWHLGGALRAGAASATDSVTIRWATPFTSPGRTGPARRQAGVAPRSSQAWLAFANSCWACSTS